MSSKPQRDRNPASDSSDREPLPFEPGHNRKQPDKKQPDKQAAPPAKKVATTATQASKSAKSSPAKSTTGIPEVVSRRMIKRMALFCGIPTALGMSTFLVSYLIVTNDVFALPTYAVLLVSLGFFGLGVLGLSYGALSASWDEAVSGSKLGWSEFTTNWGRMTGAWKVAQAEERKAARKK